MKKIFNIVPRWLPAILIMVVIFYFSAQPGEREIIEFNIRDYISIRKVAHVLIYGFLALSYYHWLGVRPARYRLAWLLAIAYAISDEFHQSLVPLRNASMIDIFLFDNIGAFTALAWHFLRTRKNHEKEIK